MAGSLAEVDPRWAWSPYEPDQRRPWNRAQAAHLYRRAGFAANWRELNEAVAHTPADAVEKLFSAGPSVGAFERQMDSLSATLLTAGGAQRLSAWWLYRMLHTPDPLTEKTTLFWHGHFATSAEKVNDPRAMLAQHALLRENALGSFAPMVQGISRDPAMLIYLDSVSNRKSHPNENYAREVMELFCLGLGAYTERDIQELARCFTGWEIYRGRFRFNEYQHDFGSKTLLGKTGNFDGDQGVEIVLAQPAAARFIARKLIHYFVCDEPTLPEPLVEALAQQLREQQFDVGHAVRTILGSQLFFSEHAAARKVRSPVELGIGLLRALEATTNMTELAADLAQLGQAVFFPPNVKGWDGGRTWINSSTLLGRANLIGRLVRPGESRLAGGGMAELAASHGVDGPEAFVDWLLELLVAVPVDAPARQPLVALARSSDMDNEGVAGVVQAIGALPEFQLC